MHTIQIHNQRLLAREKTDYLYKPIIPSIYIKDILGTTAIFMMFEHGFSW